MNVLQDNAVEGLMQAWQPVDKVWAGTGKTGGNVVIDAPNTGKPAPAQGHSIYDSFSRDLDFFLIDVAVEYDYILCLVVFAADWVFLLQPGPCWRGLFRGKFLPWHVIEDQQ